METQLKVALKNTPLIDEHKKSHAKLVDFAGYNMPINYSEGMIAEHNWVRSHAGLFDVSHMGQIIISGIDSVSLLEQVTPSKFSDLKISEAKYTTLLNDNGGIIDDLIITRFSDDSFFLVVNAARFETDHTFIKKSIKKQKVEISILDRALIAIQGPDAEAVLKNTLDSSHKEVISNLAYMQNAIIKDNILGELYISRLGYTGEDGFEISITSDKAIRLWQQLLKDSSSKPIGLGARNTLRMEMGYPLYGDDIDEQTTPVEANLGWIISKNNNSFNGFENIQEQKQEGVFSKRVGVKILDRGIVRGDEQIFSENGEELLGNITSGCFSPTLNSAIAQAYIDIDFVKPGTKLKVQIRNKKVDAEIIRLPFIKPKTKSN